MDGSDSNDVVKRRLPPWMMGVASVEKGRVGDSGNDNENRVDDDGGGCREEGQKVKNRGGRRRKQKVTVVAVQEQRDNFSDGLGLELEQGCEDTSSSPVESRDDRKRNKRKLNLDSEEPSRITTKRKNRQIRANQRSEDAAAVTECCSEDEDCLTVEDLMIFANECVQGRHDNTIREDEFVEENKRKSEVEEINSTLPSSSCIQTKNVNLKVSGDHHPNQDMLDLLLGPSLKKAQEKGKKKLDLAIDMDAFNFEKKRYEEEEVEVKDMGGGAVGQEQAASIVTVNQKKKKTSLKDQVAMFLD